MSCDFLDVSGCAFLERLPDNLRIRRISVSFCHSLKTLPAGLRCYELDGCGIPIACVPGDIRVESRLDLSGCAALRTLPAGLQVTTLIVSRSPQLAGLPERFQIQSLDVSGCEEISAWPAEGPARMKRLCAAGCYGLKSLPPWLREVSQLDLRGCAGIVSVPDHLRVMSWIDIGDTGIRRLPPLVKPGSARWRGVAIPARIAGRLDSITAADVLAEEQSPEARRIMLECLGIEAFVAGLDAICIDSVSNGYDVRKLLCVLMAGNRTLACLSVLDTMSRRLSVIRVPGDVRSCRQASDWIARSDDLDHYLPAMDI